MKPNYFERRYLGETTFRATALDLGSEDYGSKTSKPLLENTGYYPSHRCVIDTSASLKRWRRGYGCYDITWRVQNLDCTLSFTNCTRDQSQTGYFLERERERTLGTKLKYSVTPSSKHVTDLEVTEKVNIPPNRQPAGSRRIFRLLFHPPRK